RGIGKRREKRLENLCDGRPAADRAASQRALDDAGISVERSQVRHIVPLNRVAPAINERGDFLTRHGVSLEAALSDQPGSPPRTGRTQSKNTIVQVPTSACCEATAVDTSPRSSRGYYKTGERWIIAG